MFHNLKLILKFLISLGLAIAFLHTAFQDIDFYTFGQALHKTQPIWLVFSAFFLMVSNFPRAWRWQILMAPVSRKISLRYVFRALLIGYAANNLLPRAGEVARVVSIKQNQDLSGSALLATVLVERVLDMLSLLLLFGVVLFFFRSDIENAFPWMENVSIIASTISILFLILFGILSTYGNQIVHPLRNITGFFSTPLGNRLTEILRAFFLGMGGIRNTTGFLRIVFATILINGIYTLVVYLAFMSFQFPRDFDLNLTAALVVLVISTVGIIIPTPGGTGSYHFFCSQALYKIYKVPKLQALAFATTLHGISYLTFLIFGGPGLLHLLWNRRKAVPEEPEIGPQ